VFIAFWLGDNRVLAGMNVNFWGTTEPIKRLIRSETPLIRLVRPPFSRTVRTGRCRQMPAFRRNPLVSVSMSPDFQTGDQGRLAGPGKHPPAPRRSR
jgi:hypothetical protein